MGKFSSWREESTKTRIETILHLHQTYRLNRPEEKNPLKQGLKLPIASHNQKELLPEEKNPLKQGLKHYFFNLVIYLEHPWREESTKTRIETSIISTIVTGLTAWREESTKTRIETNFTSILASYALSWREESTKTGLKLSSDRADWSCISALKRRIH